ncbi:hypothetical protein [Arhodomonas aquaeolei]|uniref:hypothetical protein n=1 Tax=Arhodomonas aquaeolei TaxID=2369 RepID=UPI0003767464|nr:hypothetical protein [Arhodomonas aquaeolei]
MAGESVHKRPVAGELTVHFPRLSIAGTFGGADETFVIADVDERLASLVEPGLLRSGFTELRFTGRRYRLDDPRDRGAGEIAGDVLGRLFGRPRRRVTWRAGAGVVAELETDSTVDSGGIQKRRSWTAHYRLDGTGYKVLCRRHSAGRRGLDRTLFADGLAVAEAVPNPFSALELDLTVQRPVPLDALAIAVHMMGWLPTASGSAGGGTAGGGGGDGGGGC